MRCSFPPNRLALFLGHHLTRHIKLNPISSWIWRGKKISKLFPCYIVEMKISPITLLSARRLCVRWKIIDWFPPSGFHKHILFVSNRCFWKTYFGYDMWKTLQLFTTHLPMGRHHSLIVTKVTFVFVWLQERGSSDTVLKWQKMCLMGWNESLTKQEVKESSTSCLDSWTLC